MISRYPFVAHDLHGLNLRSPRLPSSGASLSLICLIFGTFFFDWARSSSSIRTQSVRLALKRSDQHLPTFSWKSKRTSKAELLQVLSAICIYCCNPSCFRTNTIAVSPSAWREYSTMRENPGLMTSVMTFEYRDEREWTVNASFLNNRALLWKSYRVG